MNKERGKMNLFICITLKSIYIYLRVLMFCIFFFFEEKSICHEYVFDQHFSKPVSLFVIFEQLLPPLCHL